MLILTNARLVLVDRVLHGTVVVDGERVVEVQPGRSAVPGALDLDGDVVMPGIIDVHTDNLERQVQPRANARWPSRSAMVAHDAQCAASGVTTVLDALCLGELGFDESRTRTFHDGVADLDALAGTGLLKSEHFLHLRCELPAPNMLDLLEPVADHPRVRMVSLMDHSPGVGQYSSLDNYRALRRRDGLDAAAIERRIQELQEQRARLRGPNRDRLLARMAASEAALASHDDRTEDEVAENHAIGIRISEFPVAMEAARAAKARGMDVIAGAPNIVRGGSHSGNVTAADLVKARLVDGLASDYVPASLVESAFRCVDDGSITLPEGVALVTRNPARMAGLDDRGELAPGKRADLVRVRVHEGLPFVRQVWRAGERGNLKQVAEQVAEQHTGALSVMARLDRAVSANAEAAERAGMPRPSRGMTKDGARVAAYWAPAASDPLWELGCTWLGRDPGTGAALPQPDVPGIADATADARLYGFHATLKAPMRVATGWDAVRADAARVAASLQPFDLPPLRISNLSGFLALTEARPSASLQAFADAFVAGLDPHRVPPLPGELDRRRAGGLSPEAEAMLVRWGYPAAFGTWRFHMTLTCRLPDQERAPFEAAAARHFAQALALPRRAEEVCLFGQPGPGLPFTLAERLPLGG